MPDLGRWSHKYHLDGREPPNESIPPSDLYYSLNVLLGLSKVRPALAAEPYDPAVLLPAICAELPRHRVRNGAWGMALWAAAALDMDAPAIPADRLRRLAGDVDSLSGWRAQDIGLSLIGAAAQARGDRFWRNLVEALGTLLLTHFRGPRALFRDSGRGPRRLFATFATQVYVAIALYAYGELFENEEALAAASACVAKLIELQGPMGEWPWLYFPREDRVLDPYEVYSVHQHGMGPALLHHAVNHGVPGAREAIVRGCDWIFGANQMGISMLVPALQLIYRSQARTGLGGRNARILHAATAIVAGGNGWPGERVALRLTREMRSYEFGWLLWSFGDRSDYPEFTHNSEFSGGSESTAAPVWNDPQWQATR